MSKEQKKGYSVPVPDMPKKQKKGYSVPVPIMPKKGVENVFPL